MASRLEFRILGPLSVRVDGEPVPIGGPKQRALLALLLLGANRVVSRDRLIGELFAEQSVNSADHALRNHVSRLRKVLSPAVGHEPRLVARPPGYLLRVDPGELDLERFERLAADGREALAAGDALAAAASFRQAEALWEGRPLADLEFEPFARVEVERLEELRLASVEERIDAELALGCQLALVGEIESLTAEHPYRERFRAQLMLALYRSGRQAEGLEVYRRTRAFLNDELGLEPGGELQELERAILTQDRALDLGSAGVGVLPHERDICPYQGLAPFETADAEFFFGRERLVDELSARLAEAPLLALIGASGSGKSSLLRAGLLPALVDFDRVLLRPGDPLPTLAAGRTVVAVDQFEELFGATFSERARRDYIDALVEVAWDPERRALVLLALRADFFGHVAPYVELADLIGPNHALLGPMSRAELRRAIEGPAERVGLEVDPALVDALVDDVAGEAGGLPLLSTALADLWGERDGRLLALPAYERIGGVRGAVGRHAEAAVASLDDNGRQIARRVLLRLVAGGDGEPLTRRRVSRGELDADSDPRVANVIETLVERRLLVADEGAYEFVHEALLDQWPRLAGWLKEDAEGRRVRRQLTDAAVRWDADGRDAGELYRGARLAAALDWSESEAAGLNRLERQFLDESRAASVRANRRLRALLAAAMVLLVLAVIAGVVAFQARGKARQQATAAVAERLGAQALVEPQIDRALLLAREGVDLDDTTATRSNLLAALLRAPAALAVIRGRDAQVLDEALSDDGRLLILRGNSGNVSFFDTRTLREVGRPFKADGQLSYCGAIIRPVRAVAVSPDSRTVAVGDFDGHQSTLYLIDAERRVLRATQVSGAGATDDVAYAPNGRTLVTGQTTSCASSPPPEQLVLRRASDGSVLHRSNVIPGGRLIGFTPNGRFLLATSGETTSYLFDAHTLVRVRAFKGAGSGAVSPTADMAAFGQDDGSVSLVDLRTGAVHPMDRRATGKVIGVAFSRDGEVLATTSDDGTVDVWDVPTARLRETFTGHAGAAVSPVFSPDGRTLYTASHDGSVIAWDVRGNRRLGRLFRFAPVAATGAGPLGRGNGAGAVAVSPDSSLFVTSPGPNRVTLWRTRDLDPVAELRGPYGGAQSLAFSHNGRLVAATGNGRETVVWDIRTHKIDKLLGPAGKGGNIGVNFSPDDRIVGTAGEDGTVRLYDVRTGERVAKLIAYGTEQDIDFSSDGRWVAAAGLGEQISIWDTRTKSLERTIDHNELIFAIRFSPDGTQIATGDVKGNVDFWDVATGRRVGREIGGQNGAVISVSYSPDGKEVMTTSSDGKFRLIDIATGKLVGAPLPGDGAAGWGTFFPNGKQIVVALWSGDGVVWNVDPSAWAAQACRVAHRNLTPAEWHDFLPSRPYRRICA
jgi:WD40 repeat protein/DNA-binding SARP family transcriptional activator